ncbi:MAG: hypothetical protein PHF67_03745 [Candidatus Nanoarchaeia archaeon]|nr:hypothetical protein [Candidatus Nanoarchaeia archaeon]
MITFVYLSLGIVVLVFFILCFINKEKSIRLKAQSSIIDSMTLSSGVILILYLIGKAWNIEYLKAVDEFSLGLATILASIILISDVIDKYYKSQKSKK